MELQDWVVQSSIDKFRFVKIQPKTIDLSTRLWGINTEFVGFIPQSLVLRPIVLNLSIRYGGVILLSGYFVLTGVNRSLLIY